MQERDGWYSAHAFERIKTVLRHKFFSLLEGHVPTDEECEALLVDGPTSNKSTLVRNKKLRPGKHNMAKGALRPEDAAVRGCTALCRVLHHGGEFIVDFVADVGCKVTCDVGQERKEFTNTARYRVKTHFQQRHTRLFLKSFCFSACGALAIVVHRHKCG